MLQGMKGNHDIKSQLQAMIEENSENEFFLQNALNAMQSWKSSSAQTIGSNGEKVGKLIKKFKNLIVPVVCDDMFEYVDDLNCTHTLNEFICQRYNDILDNEEVKASIMELAMLCESGCLVSDFRNADSIDAITAGIPNAAKNIPMAANTQYTLVCKSSTFTCRSLCPCSTVPRRDSILPRRDSMPSRRFNTSC